MDEPEGGERKDSAQASVSGLLVSTEFDSPLLVFNGLQLINAQSQKLLKCFSYVLSPFTKGPVHLEKLIWHQAYPICSEHIRCHVLDSDDDIPKLIAQYRQESAQAVILINTANNYTLASPSLHGDVQMDIPVIVVTSSDGDILLSIINDCPPGEVVAQIVPKHSGFLREQSPSIRRKKKGSSKSELIRGSPKGLIDPWKQFQLYAFSLEGPVSICSKTDVFQFLMSAFDQYEFEAKLQCEGPGKQSENLLKKLLRHLEEHKTNHAVFDENFPLYVLLAIRMYRNRDVYQCGDLDKFIETVMERVESLPAKKIAEVLNGFLQQGDFEIMDGHDRRANVSAFRQLYSACEQMVVFRFDKKHKRYLYCLILWITIAIRCCQFDDTLMFDEMPETAEKLWNKYILQDKSSIDLTSEVITDIQKGLTLGGCLLLPEEVRFSESRMSILLFPHGQMQPLQHIRNFTFHVMEFLRSEERFVKSIVKASRDHYDNLLFPNKTATLSSKYVHASSARTVHGLVEEGVSFLNVVFLVAMQRRWNGNDLKTHCKGWFSLLVKTIEIKRGAESTLRILLKSGREDTITKNKEFRLHIETEIIKKTRGMFGKLNISVFYPLYREFYIWTNEFLADYLKNYHSSQAELADENWTLLFKDVVNRYPSSNSHVFILQFLLSEAAAYAKAGKAETFILHLMKLDVPNLFAGPPHSISESFKNNLHCYIIANSLSRELQRHVEILMDCIHDDPHSFQDLILVVLQKDITPQMYSSAVVKTALRLLNTVINVLNKNVCPQNNLTRKERFCWGIIGTFCEQIKPQLNSFKWAESFTAIIEKMGEIYVLYCQKRSIKHVSLQMRPEIYRCPPDVVKYYEWVQQIHNFFSNWHTKFMVQEVNHDDMVDYLGCHSSLCKVAKAVCTKGMIIKDEHISELRTNYLKDFEQLNLLLLRYVHEVPRVKWRVLTSVLNMYGIGLPKALQEQLEQFVVLPGEIANPAKLTLQRNALKVSTTSKFQPPQPISLMLSEGFTLKKMETFIRDLKSFLTPIQDNMNMLIFFSLHESMLFSAYVKQELKMDADLNAFGQALVRAKNILIQVCQGEAYYSQITANGAVCLENLDIQKEFSILVKSEQLDKLPGLKTTLGLGDVINLVDLMKICAHIQVVRHVCQQYQLEGCLNDENLTKLTAIAGELMTEEAKASLTPSSATNKMETVRELLETKGGVVTRDYEYLAIFSKVSDSAEFYQFICEKGFTGESGEARFHQQYQLITAQLQHEEYDEAVLNVLYAAYKLLLPFTKKIQPFHSLLESVKQLLTASSPVGGAKTTHDYLVQIETVNRNINLIQLWFSRAEGDTMQNVGSDLERIFQTGHYNFIIPENMADPGKVELIYKPSTKRTLVANTEVHSEEQKSVIHLKDESVKAEIWDREQAGTFVRKLGFLDSEKAGGEMVKPFLHINEVANKLLEFLLKLRELGYPSHLTDVAKNGLKCNVHADEADRMVDEMEHIMKEWSQDVDKLLLRHSWLLLLSIPKLLRLSKLLRSDFHLDSLAIKIMEETSFLFSRQMKDSGRVIMAIKDSLKTLQKEKLKLEKTDDASVSLRICGIFMDEIVKHPVIVDCSPQKYSDKDRLMYPACSRRSLLYSTDSVEVLHSAPGFSLGELISVIVSIYDGRLPQPYEFFCCHESTTMHELKLFLTRAINHPLTFMIMGVNLLPVKLQEVVLRQHEEFHSSSDHKIQPCIHYIETLPSILHEMPWIQQEKHNVSDIVQLKDVQKRCHQQAILERGLKCVQLVYGVAGVGKTHYIREQLANCHSVTIAVNEAFEPVKAIQRLNILPKDEHECAIFFSFNLIPPFGDSVSKEDKKVYDTLMETISWFFFDLLFFGYVEDFNSGESFHLPGGLSWSIYVEVPARSSSCVDKFLEEFRSEIPIFKLLGTTRLIRTDAQYSVHSEKKSGVQLVCKYLKAYETGGRKGIDKLFREGNRQSKPVKFSVGPDLPSDVCEHLLEKFIPPSIRNTKTLQQLFLRYMERRCRFLDNLPAYNYNIGGGIRVGTGEVTDTRHLGSTLMANMIREAAQFCHPCIEEDRDYHQLIYDVQDGGGSIGLISTAPHKLTELKKIGVEIPTMVELHQREYLDKCLSRALNIPLNDKKKLTAIDDDNYVLTLDFAIKMLQIHERHECGEPVIIQGETGVGKTALIQMLSKLWNASLDMELKRLRERLLEFLQNKLKHGSSSVPDQYKAWLQAVNSMISGVKKSVEEEDLMLIAMLPCREGHLYLEMKNYLKKIAGNPLFPLLEITCQQHKPLDVLFNEAAADPSDLADYSPENEAKPVVKVFHALLTAVIKSTFHKLSVHAAMKPADLSKVLRAVFEQAQQLQKATQSGCASVSRAPNVTVFLDELNASTCGGLFKELIIDKSFEGEPIPENVFIIAACNPHRGNSLAALNVATKTGKLRANNTVEETWIMDSYYVRQLHPTLAHLMWDYGSLGEDQERQYVQAKVDMQSSWLSDLQKATLTEVIVSSQKLIRQYAFEELKKWKLTEQEARLSSKCCVSQRDIQRIFTFYEWLLKFYQRMKPYNDDEFTSSYRAILVALGVVYYMRLNRKYRARYEQDLSLKHKFTALPFFKAFQSELEWYAQQIEFPKGIAKTQALKENLLAIILCTVTQTPLIIVGAPGSSKTLSFNIAVSNLKGQESKKSVFRNTDIFLSLDPHFYQCSRCTTSNEIQTVFSRAITRQKNNALFSLPIKCVVFMDEAGLPENSHESLKILHSYLDNPLVSFVAISNTVLDAAKTNRAVTLFRDPLEITNDLKVLATECLFESPGCPPHNLREHINVIVDLYNAYTHIMTEMQLNNFFGLRDFIHFLHYIRRKCVQRDTDLSLHQVGQIVTGSLERNFSGSQHLSEILEVFLDRMNLSTADVERCDPVLVLKDSLNEMPGMEDEVRYKIVIHSSEDDSVVRLLFQLKIVERQNARIYICSDFPGDTELQKIDTIAGIRHSAIQGHSIVMLQTDDIHESFYDLFNRRFQRIDDPKFGTRLYANIAIGAHLKPCRVDPKFQCVVAIKKSELDRTPAPFLNRFEKYYITHKNVLESVFGSFPAEFKSVMEAAYKKVQQFVQCIGGASAFYGLCEETVDSLLLTVLPLEFKLPMTDRNTVPLQQLPSTDNFENAHRKQIYILQILTEAVKLNLNFRYQECSEEEMKCDAEHLFHLVLRSNPDFKGVMKREMKDPVSARVVILSALDTLQRGHVDSTYAAYAVAPATQLIRSLLVQWLVRHFCKALMQLMTPEALVLHEHQLPASYIYNYLTYQKHFSLKDLIQQQLLKMAKQGKGPSTKLLCFTRTSPLIHKLPSVYPSAFHSPTEIADYESDLKRIVFCDLSELVVCKLEGAQSQRSIKESLKTFMESDKMVMFLLANMHEVSRNTVNHLRVMIEEEEAIAKESSRPKLFLLLLHFPPSMFFTACYPSLFLEGWDHYYLDTIAHGLSIGIVDSVKWFYMSCIPSEQSTSSVEDPFFKMLKHLLHQSIPHVVSRLSFGSDYSTRRPFNQKMTPLARSKALQRLFDTEVGDALCHHFQSYWKAEVMTEYLHRAVKFTQAGKTTLNITDSIHSIMKSHFLDFVVYMVDYINDNYNLDIFFSRKTTEEVKQLFLDLTRCLPIPHKLSKLKVLSSVQQVSKCKEKVTGGYLFPFFAIVCPQIMDIVKETARELRELCHSEDLRNTDGASLQERRVDHEFDFEQQLQKQVEEHLLSKMKNQEGCVAVAVAAMSKHRELWDRYFHDFTREQLSLWSHNQQVIEETLEAAFGTVCTSSASIVSQLTSLHVYTHLNQSNISKNVDALMSLIKLTSVSEQVSGRLRSSSTSSAILLTTEDTNTFVLNTLFNTLLTIFDKHHTLIADVKLWYNAYHAMALSPAVRKRIYNSLSATSEAKLNVMHAAFLAVQYDPNDNDVLMRCQAMVNGLCREHFAMPSLELKGSGPQIAEISMAAVEAFGQPQAVDSPDVKPAVEAFIMEGLLTHFFCYYDKPHKNNVWWLLEHINEQKHLLRSSSLSRISVASQSSCDSDQVQSDLPFHCNSHCVPLNLFKYYLLKILGTRANAREEQRKQWVPPFETEGRVIVGRYLSKQISSDLPKTYVPPFYQLPGVAISENCLESQPLAYLYFMTVLEYLFNQHSDLSDLLNITLEMYETGPDEVFEKVLCCIEKQALVQVIIREFAKHLVPDYYIFVASKLAKLQKHLNAIICEQTSGGRIEVHGDILAMHMLKEAQSLEKFTRLFTELYDTHCTDYKCLQTFQGVITEPYTSRANFFDLLHQEDKNSHLRKLYMQVQRTVSTTVEGKGELNKLIKLAKESQKGQMSLQASAETPEFMEKVSCLRMVFWLTVYQCLYNQEKQSKELTDACNKLPPTLFDMPFVQLIRWFACPKGHATTGPLNHLFSLSNKDPTDIHLRHSVANLVACALGTRTCEKSSHLWYLAFAPEALRGTYLAGYMIDGPVSVEEGRPYQEGAQITNDDLCHLLQHSIKRDLSLNSRCMLLWINVASFCVSLLTRGHERLSGILASTERMEKYCVSQLRHIWKFMRNNMQLTDEELSYLVMMCMRAYLQCWETSQESMSGLFTDQAKVAKYEQQWHSIIFLPCLKKLRVEFIRYLPTPVRKLLVDIRQIQTCYPHFPDSTTALYSLLSLADVQMESQEKLTPLSQFICKMPEVQTMLPYLPDFLEFYHWLHRDLAGVLTPETAHKISIKNLVNQMSKHYAAERGNKLMSLYQRVKDGYNHYLRAAGCITSAGGFEGIRVRNFLTLDASTLMANTDDDILYKLIYEMVTCHNSLLDCSQVIASHSEKTQLSRYLSPDTLTVTPVDVTENTCILGKSEGANLDTEFLQLVCRRHQVSTKTHFADVVNPHLLTVEDLLKLQEDVASLYLGGRPKIANISSMHIPFTFKVSKPTYEAHPLNFGQDLNQVGKLLPPTLKHDFTDDHTVLQLLECEFHSVDYHTMLDVVTGLKTAITLLEKRVQQTCSDGTDLNGLTLRSFLCNEEGKEEELEIFGKRLSGHQLSSLMKLKVSSLYHTFTTFTQWAIEGRYDFHRLPYALKAHLNPEDVEQLRKMPSLYKKAAGSESMDLLREFKLLGEVLDLLESNLMVVGTQVPLVDYLTPMDIFEGHDEFLGLIPKTVLIQHYVSLRILLKHLTAEVQKDLPNDKEEQDRRWLELVPSFSGEIYEAQPETIQADYGFKHGYNSDTESIKVETCSSVTQFDLLHEDDLDEFRSLHTSDLKSLTGATSLSVKESPVTQMSVDALQNFPVATSTEEKTDSESHHQAGVVPLQSTPSAPVLDEKQLLQLARQYSSEAVANFVISIGYPDYAEQFEENGLSGDALMECTDEDLEDLGIKSALARLKIIILFRRQLHGLGSLAKHFPADRVVEFLDGLKQPEKEQYKKSFSDHQIDGEMLLAMQGKDDVMIELGVQRPIHRRIILSKFKTLIEEQGHSTT